MKNTRFQGAGVPCDPRPRRRGDRASAVLVAACALTLGLPRGAEAGGPLLVQNGIPRRWATETPVALNLDRGSLGTLSNAQVTAIMEHAVSEWSNVPTSTLRVQMGEPLPTDIEALSESQFNTFVTRNDGTNPVILDSRGKIIDALFGEQSGVIGAAGPSLVQPATGTIVKGFAVFNGRQTRGIETLRAVVVHELGHLFNLDHAQINGTYFILGSHSEGTEGSVPGFTGTVDAADVETMYPVLVQPDLSPHPMATLHKDDAAALSAIYPTSDFPLVTATVTGLVLDIDGATPLQGVNVIARNVEAPFADAVSCVSGFLGEPSDETAPAARFGAFELRGLTPGAAYKVYIEEIGEAVTGTAHAGPLDPAPDFDRVLDVGFLEFWNGVRESAENPPDDPMDAEVLAMNAGVTASGVDFVFNGVAPRVTSVTPSYGPYDAAQEVLVSGSNLAGALSAQLGQPPAAFLEGVEVQDPGLLQAVVPPGIVPGTYELLVSTGKGTSAPAGVLYQVTEPPPEIFEVSPDAIQNNRAQIVRIQGLHLLGIQSVELFSKGVLQATLSIVEAAAAGYVVVEVPAGLPPASYDVVVKNTAGTSAVPGPILNIVELAPILATKTVPPAGRNSRPTAVVIQGDNLAGTTEVHLVSSEESIPLVISSASLSEVAVTVPRGLVPGVYYVSITNSEGTTVGPATFTVKASSSSGGCSASRGEDGAGAGDAAQLLAALALLLGASVLRSRRQEGLELHADGKKP